MPQLSSGVVVLAYCPYQDMWLGNRGRVEYVPITFTKIRLNVLSELMTNGKRNNGCIISTAFLSMAIQIQRLFI